MLTATLEDIRADYEALGRAEARLQMIKLSFSPLFRALTTQTLDAAMKQQLAEIGKILKDADAERRSSRLELAQDLEA